MRKRHHPRQSFALFIIFFGTILILNNFGIISSENIFPIVLIYLGINFLIP